MTPALTTAASFLVIIASAGWPSSMLPTADLLFGFNADLTVSGKWGGVWEGGSGREGEGGRGGGERRQDNGEESGGSAGLDPVFPLNVFG